jgi:hypothetical protein
MGAVEVERSGFILLIKKPFGFGDQGAFAETTSL